MRMVPGTHEREVVEHVDTWRPGAMLTRGQEIAVEVDENDAIDVVLKPGEMSLHHHKIFHASKANRSTERRIGLALRYIPTHVRQIAIDNDSAALVRGVDEYGHFRPEPRPDICDGGEWRGHGRDEELVFGHLAAAERLNSR